MIKQKLGQYLQAGLSLFSKSDVKDTQSGARSTGSAVNYLSVTTLDPTRLARAFQAADEGYITDQATLFNLVEEQDSHIFSEIGKRRRSVTGLGWQLDPPDDASQSEIDRTKELSDVMRGIPNFEQMQYDLTDATGKGISAHDTDWHTGSTWYPKEYIWVPQSDLQIDKKTGQIMYVKNGLPEPLRPGGWVVHQHHAKSGYIESAALFRVLAWTYAYKAYNIRDMQRFLEMYGLPLRLGKYPAGIGDKQRNELLRAVRNIGNDGAGVVPTNMQIEFIQAMKSGTVDDFLNATTYWERKQSLAILGGTLTSQADGKTSTNALGIIHDKVRREIMLHDVEQIDPTMNNQVVKPIALVNGMFPPDRMPKYRHLTQETVDQSKMVDVLDKAAGMGMEIDVEYAHKLLQIPKADDKAKLLRPSGKPATPTPPTDAALRAALSAAGADDIDTAYARQLAALCAPFEHALIQQIGAIVAETGDPAEALDKIAALKADPKWAEAVALGLAAANLAGRADVSE